MRGGSLGGGLRLAALAASALGAVSVSAARAIDGFAAEAAQAAHHYGRTRYPGGHKPRKGGSIADRPHEHKREIARRTTNPGTQARRDAMAAAGRRA